MAEASARAASADAGTSEQVLLDQLRAHPPERDPVEHATAAFHLGTLRLDAGRIDSAITELERARRLFDPGELPVEHAKATTMLGAALRAAGRLEEAAACFDDAAGRFAQADQPGEHGAALHNRGLVARDAGEAEHAAACFQQAHDRFVAARAGPQASAAARERGAALLTSGEMTTAREVLADAAEQASRLGDLAAQGETANLIGLVELAHGQPGTAAGFFQEAAAAHPRGTRPEAFAMAKANLAVAWEQAERAARARLAARQALAAPVVPPAVRDQATQLLDRMGSGPGDALAAVDAEPAEEWPVILREETVRWSVVDGLERDAETAAWIRGLAERGPRAGDVAEPWLGALLELPPGDMDTLAAAAIRATGRLADADAQRVRTEVGRAMARFHAPQMLRLRDTFERLADELGEPSGWG